MIQSGSVISNRFKLAAIDLDGTLLGPDHAIHPANADAIRRLQAAGAQVILASGRHYNSMHKYVEALPGVQWVVSCQGGELSNADRSTVLNRQFLAAADVKKTMEAGRANGFTTVAYAVEGIFSDATWDAEMDFYTELAGHRPVSLASEELLARPMFKVIWMGDPAALSRLTLATVATPQVQAVRTNARFLEFMPADVSKASALNILARHFASARQKRWSLAMARMTSPCSTGRGRLWRCRTDGRWRSSGRNSSRPRGRRRRPSRGR